MDEILDIQSRVAFDESIAHYEVHAHQPYATSSFDNSDEIRIAIQHQDLCVLPSRSSLHICGKIVDPNGLPLKTTNLSNNAMSFLFEEIRYEMNAIEVDKCKNVGIISLMKGWLSHTPSQKNMLENAGWIGLDDTKKIMDKDGNFDVIIPLSMILGFAEDYRKIVVNVKHELILTRARNDLNLVLPVQNAIEDFRTNLSKVEWLMPYVTLSDSHKIRLLNYLSRDKIVSMSFRSWELYEYPFVPETIRHVWTVKTSNYLEKPRFIILGFQTERTGRAASDASKFNHCDISNVKLYLNSQSYPYGDLNINMTHNQYALLYDMYVKFQSSYYGKDPEPLLSKKEFNEHIPLIVIDCSKQNESMKNAPVDVRLEFEVRENMPGNTSAYCLIIHDRIMQYNPMSGDVKKLV